MRPFTGQDLALDAEPDLLVQRRLVGGLASVGTISTWSAFTPRMRESDHAAISSSRVFVDTYPGALAEAGDLLQLIATGRICGNLHELTNGAKAGRLDRDDITLFKSVGAAIEDLAAASLMVNEANPVHTRNLPSEGPWQRRRDDVYAGKAWLLHAVPLPLRHDQCRRK
jgi:hypothetical protein